MSTAEWRKLADEYAVYSCERGFLSGALVAACDRIDELEKEGSALDWRDACDLANKRAEAAEARVAELEAESNQKSRDWVAAVAIGAELKARLAVAVGALSAWLAAYEATGPDNGPSLIEHECAEQARAALAKLRGETADHFDGHRAKGET